MRSALPWGMRKGRIAHRRSAFEMMWQWEGMKKATVWSSRGHKKRDGDLSGVASSKRCSAGSHTVQSMAPAWLQPK